MHLVSWDAAIAGCHRRARVGSGRAGYPTPDYIPRRSTWRAAAACHAVVSAGGRVESRGTVKCSATVTLLVDVDAETVAPYSYGAVETAHAAVVTTWLVSAQCTVHPMTYAGPLFGAARCAPILLIGRNTDTLGRGGIESCRRRSMSRWSSPLQ